MTRVAIYLRQSLDATGEELAIQRQRKDCLRIVRERNWNVVAEYVDNSISASGTKKRPAYDAMVQAYQAGEFDALVCWDLDRLTRQPDQLRPWIEGADRLGFRIVTANGEADLSTDAGILFARVKLAVAENEFRRKSKRQKAAAVQRSELGRPPLGVRLTGYTARGEVVEDEAVTVRFIFAEFADGDSLKSIAMRLNDKGTPTRRGGRWNPSTVRDILGNPRYAGRAVYMGEETGKAGGWEAMVDGDVFDAVSAKLADPRRRTHEGTDRKHLGSGLYECAICGAKVSGWSQNRYRCKNACVNRSHGPVDGFVVRLVRTRLANTAKLGELLASQDSAEAKAARDEVKRLRARLATIEADYDAGHVDGRRYAVASEKTRAELATALADQGRLSGVGTAASVLSAPNPVAAFDEAPLMIRRAVVEALCVVKLSPAPRGSHTFDPMTLGDSSWTGDDRNWRSYLSDED
jgi:site-specific DNA recombinase